jgi:hypothetical protein
VLANRGYLKLAQLHMMPQSVDQESRFIEQHLS